jgi:hypothetical protein
VSPTPTATPAATPHPPFVAVQDLTQRLLDEGASTGWTVVSGQDLSASIARAYAADGEAAALVNPDFNMLEKDVLAQLTDTCTSSTDEETIKIACSNLFNQLYFWAYLKDGDPVWITDAADGRSPVANVVLFAHSRLSKDQWDGFVYRMGKPLQ